MAPFLTFAFVPLLTGIGWWLSHRLPWPRLRTALRVGLAFLCVTSTCLLVAAVPAGSVDISDLPAFLILGLLPAASVFILALSRQTLRPWLQRPAKALGWLTLIPAIALFFVLCLGQAACTKSIPPIYSPGGQYVAILSFAVQGALGADHAVVRVRRAYTPWFTIVYSGYGAWNLPNRAHSPEVRWLDSSRLLIRYSGGRREPPTCVVTEAAGVQIVCESSDQRDARAKD